MRQAVVLGSLSLCDAHQRRNLVRAPRITRYQVSYSVIMQYSRGTQSTSISHSYSTHSDQLLSTLSAQSTRS